FGRGAWRRPRLAAAARLGERWGRACAMGMAVRLARPARLANTGTRALAPQLVSLASAKPAISRVGGAGGPSRGAMVTAALLAVLVSIASEAPTVQNRRAPAWSEVGVYSGPIAPSMAAPPAMLHW